MMIAPAVASGAQLNVFLVVWQAASGAGTVAGEIAAGAILARRIGADGTLGPTIFLGDGMEPDVAYNDAAEPRATARCARRSRPPTPTSA